MGVIDGDMPSFREQCDQVLIAEETCLYGPFITTLYRLPQNLIPEYPRKKHQELSNDSGFLEARRESKAESARSKRTIYESRDIVSIL